MVHVPRLEGGASIYDRYDVCTEVGLGKMGKMAVPTAQKGVQNAKKNLLDITYGWSLGRVRHVGRVQQQAERPRLVEAARGST